VLAGGCKKSSPTEEPGKQTTASPSTLAPQTSSVARIHWLGKKRIAAETNSAGFMKIWSLPESIHLETETLDKLALSLAKQLPITNHPSLITNYHPFLKGPSALLRPMLDDLLQEESYLEIRGSTNQSIELVLAIKLNDQQAALWRTNLALAVESLTDAKTIPSPGGQAWQLESTKPASRIHHVELSRQGDWTLVGLPLAPTSQPANSNRSGDTATIPPLPGLQDLRARIERDHAPSTRSTSNFWFDAENLDLRLLAHTVGLHIKLPAELPRLSLTVIGDGENVRTRGQFDFSQPLSLNLEPWKIPTNLISGPLTSFTAMRGFQSWLTSFKPWRDLEIGAAPNQLFVWALENSFPAGTFFATPQADAQSRVAKLTDLILQKGSQFFATNPIAKFERSQTSNGLEWKGIPYVVPFLNFVSTNGGEFVLGGVFAPAAGSSPAPGELLQQISGATNLVFYDWELTGLRSDQWIYMGQFVRYAAYIPQMEPEFASQHWLKTVSLTLGNCVTAITLGTPNQISFVRKSTVGFTAIELHLLADWLDAPNFPRGLHSFIPVPRDLPPTAAEKPEQNKSPKR